MVKDDNINKNNLIITGFFLALGLVISSMFISNSIAKIKKSSNTINVKGFASQEIIADTVKWSCKVAYNSPSLKKGYKKIKSDTETVIKFIKNKGITSENLIVSPMTNFPKYKKNENGYSTNIIDYYTFEQLIIVNSSDVKTISMLSKEALLLINDDINIQSFSPEYYISNLEEIKIELLGKATQNANLRAKQLSENSNTSISGLKSASQGVFQVTPLNSIDFAGYGTYDTTTINKEVKAVVTMEYYTD